MDPQRVRIYQAEALVLHQQDYAEADRILTLLTPRGKLRALAKGIRRPMSHKAGHLDLFMRVNLQLARGRNLDIITQAECVENFDHLREDVGRYTCACYVGELLEYVAQEDEPLAYFGLAVETLRRVDIAHMPSLWLRYFDLALMSYAGYQPELYHCVHCKQEIRAELNYLSLDLGGLLCPNCVTAQALPVSLNAQKLLRYLQKHNVNDITKLSVGASTLAETERHMLSYWQHVLEREIKSATALKQHNSISTVNQIDTTMVRDRQE